MAVSLVQLTRSPIPAAGATAPVSPTPVRKPGWLKVELEPPMLS